MSTRTRGTSTMSSTTRTLRLGHLRLTTVEGDTTGPHELAVDGDEGALLLVQLLVSGAATVEQDGRTARLRPGELVFLDPARPLVHAYPEPFRARWLALPRGILGLREEQGRALLATPIGPETPLGSLVSSFLNRLPDTAAGCSPGTGAALAGSAVELLTLLAEDLLSRAAPGTPGLARLLEIQEYIEDHLGDPDLTPEAVARANQISVRYLHKLFQADGTTVGQFVQRCRLRRCRGELARRDATTRSIAGVARQWGFTSASHFSRAFRAVYGMSPAEWRDPAARPRCTAGQRPVH
ncbi:helix-turn-helix domain-containing protein [Streptomyces sp. NPDC048182]|uniref:helix-turn-helix domain-containing protein n=1 Tax=Streptomyces sp. NPDC048182 TaxID=3365507 RepID=UPI00371BF33F